MSFRSRRLGRRRDETADIACVVTTVSARYGKGVVHLKDEYIDEAEVRRRLDAIFQRRSYRPPTLPRVAMKVLELSRRADADFSHIAKVLEQDAMITGQVLRLAQSPAYAGRIAATSIAQALSRLGLKTVRDLVLQVALDTKVFRAKAYQPAMDSLRRHSLAVAHLSRLVARFTALDSEYAFLCGLMHDVGLAGGLVALAEGRSSPPPIGEVWPAVFAYHGQAGQRMTSLWKLPSDVVMTAEHHHTVLVEGYPHPMCATVRLADVLATELGAAVTGTGAHVSYYQEMPLDRTLEVLGLTEPQVRLLTHQAMDVLSKVGPSA